MTERLKPLDLKDIENLFKNSEKGILYSGYVEQLFNEIKQQIKSACEFWLRYKDKPELLVKEYPELKGELRRFGLDVNVIESISSKDSEVWVLAKSYTAFKHFDKEKYQEWLFKLAFKGAIKDARV